MNKLKNILVLCLAIYSLSPSYAFSHETSKELVIHEQHAEDNPQKFLVYGGLGAIAAYIIWQLIKHKAPRVARILSYLGGDDDSGGGGNTLGVESKVINVAVARQEGADCGFHAVGNGAFLFNQVTRPGNNQLSPDQISKLFNDELVFDLARHKVRMREEFGVSSWLQDNEVDSLALHEAGLNPNSYVVIPNIQQFNPVQADADRYIKILNNLRSRDGAAALFLIGNMGEYRSDSGAVRGSCGHWIAVVVQRTHNQLIYYVMDSLGGRRESMVAALKNLVEQTDLDKFQLSQLAHYLNTVRECLDNRELRATESERIDRALRALEAIEKYAFEFSLCSKKTFQNDYAKPAIDLLNRLRERAQAYVNELEKIYSDQGHKYICNYVQRIDTLLKLFSNGGPESKSHVQPKDDRKD